MQFKKKDSKIFLTGLDMVDSRIRGYPPSRWRLWEVFGSNLACSSLIQDSLFYRDDWLDP